MNRITTNTKIKSEAVSELTVILESIIRELVIASPQTISVFFDGREVYRQQTEAGTVYWWGTDDNTSQLTVEQIPLVSSH